MKPLSTVASQVQASATMALDALYKQMKADGEDVIGFAAGEPDFDTPDHIKEAGIAAIQNNETRYTPASGTVELKRAVCQRLREDCGVDYQTNQIVVSSGAKHIIYVALQALVNPGDEVILPAPYWVSYLELIRMVGGTPVIVSAGEHEEFKLTPDKLEAAVTDKTKCLILNNPSNPTGMMYTRSELQAIANICVRHDIYVLSDEIYYKLVYDGAEFISLPSLGDEIKARTILINGVSKSYAMTGWRIGYSASNPEIAKVMANYLSHSTSAPNTIAQKAALAALTSSQEPVEQMRLAFQQRRDYMESRMNAIPGISCLLPHGAFYVMMNIEKLMGKTMYGTTIRSADDFSDIFLRVGHVCIVPCTSFGAPTFLRWSYATSMENIREGMDRLEKFLAGAGE